MSNIQSKLSQYDEYTHLHSDMVGLEQTIYLGTFLATDISSCNLFQYPCMECLCSWYDTDSFSTK